MTIWKRIYNLIKDRINEKDRAFELAYLWFGNAREWLVTQCDLRHDWRVLEMTVSTQLSVS